MRAAGNSSRSPVHDADQSGKRLVGRTVAAWRLVGSSDRIRSGVSAESVDAIAVHLEIRPARFLGPEWAPSACLSQQWLVVVPDDYKQHPAVCGLSSN